MLVMEETDDQNGSNVKIEEIHEIKTKKSPKQEEKDETVKSAPNSPKEERCSSEVSHNDDCEIIEAEENTTSATSYDTKRSLEEQSEPLPKKIKVIENLAEDKPDENDGTKNSDNLTDLEAQEMKLLADIEYLDQLARKKEREWNQLIHAKKVKEEQMLRVQRRRQIDLINKSDVDWELALDLHIKSLNQVHKNSVIQDAAKRAIALTESGVTIQPIAMSTPFLSNHRVGETVRRKPTMGASERSLLNNIAPSTMKQRMLPRTTYNDYGANGSLKTGPKGQPMMDVNLIVEKFRQSNPEVPRRGKRIRDHRSVLRSETDTVTSTSKSIPSLSITQKSASAIPIMPNRVDVNSELGLLLAHSDSARGRDTQNDSSRSSDSQPDGSSNVSFKDVLAEFARMSRTNNKSIPAVEIGNGKQNDIFLRHRNQPLNCPEVTLHPVVDSDVRSTLVSSNSLLHGILTKNKSAPSSSKPFLSPTLARLLTDSSSQPSDVSNISDLLSNNQNQSEQPSPNRYNTTIQAIDVNKNVGSQYSNEVVNLDDIENEDSLDRLVIDESNENSNITVRVKNDDEKKNSSAVPLCQGCKKNSAQFVCAGCTSQWYCSRECQVSDWDQHCEICTG